MHYIYFFFFFIAKKITLRILQIFPSLTKRHKNQRWDELIFTCLATKFRVLYILWTEPEWHQLLQLHTLPSWNPEMSLCFMDSFYYCHVQETEHEVGAILWLLFVSNYIVMKDNDLNYFPCFEEKEYFPLYCVGFFFFFWKKRKSQLYILSH